MVEKLTIQAKFDTENAIYADYFPSKGGQTHTKTVECWETKNNFKAERMQRQNEKICCVITGCFDALLELYSKCSNSI